MKNNLHQIEFLDLTLLDKIEAHFVLGSDVRNAVHRKLNSALDEIDTINLSELISKVKRIRRVLENKAKNTDLAGKIAQSYLDCLEAWAKGANIENFRHPKIENRNISIIELALLLQLENVGCQTGVFRQENGSVIMWHTEEDVEEENNPRFDKLRIVSLKSGNSVFFAFVYPDLLPGCAFSWTDRGIAMAVDTILANAKLSEGFFSNFLYWAVLFYNEELRPYEIITRFSPIIDAGAITIVLPEDNIRVEKMEFIANEILTSCLDSQPGSFLFQSNVFSTKNSRLLSFENVQREKRRLFEAREIRTKEAINRLQSFSLCDFYAMMTSRKGGTYAYANKDVKAYFLSRVSKYSCEIWVGTGKAQPQKKPIIIRHFFNNQ